MNDFLSMMDVIFKFLKLSINIYGYTISFYQIAIFVMLAGLVGRFLSGIFGYDE